MEAFRRFRRSTADHHPSVHRLHRTDGTGADLQLHAARQLLHTGSAVARELHRYRRAGLLHFLRLVALPCVHQRRDPAGRLLSAGGRAEANQGAPGAPAHSADRGAAFRRREHPAAGLGALLRQERLPRRCAQGGDGSGDREPGQQRAGHRLRHLLHLPALYAVPHPAGAQQCAQGGARGGLRTWVDRAGGFFGTSNCRWRCLES